VLPIYKADFWVTWAKAMERQLFGIDMAGMMVSAFHPLYFHFLEHLNDGEYSPSIMFPSLPSICNDGEDSLSFLSSFPFEAFAMIESTPYLKSSFSFANSLKDRENCYPMVPQCSMISKSSCPLDFWLLRQRSKTLANELRSL
jgi:hypothetical protein